MQNSLAIVTIPASLLLLAITPGGVDLIAESVVPRGVFPTHGTRDEINYSGGSWSNDAVENRVVIDLRWRERKRIPARDVGIVAAAELAFRPEDLAQICLSLEAAARTAHECWIKT